MQDSGEPALGQQRFDEGRQFARNRLADECRTGAPLGFPTPFEAVIGQTTDQITVPGDQKIERGFIHRRSAAGFGKQEAFGALPLPIPFVLASKRPDRISRRLGCAVFRHQPRGHLRAHLGGDGAGVFAPQPKGFEEALSWRRRADAQFSEIIANDGDRRRG